MAREFAPGLPDPKRFGRVTSLPKGVPLPWVIQRHLADRAGPHYDIRFGPDKMHSWAARKLPTEPGQKTLAFRQPLHAGAYANFEGEIVSGYGKGTVKTHDKGQVLVTKAEPGKINFVVAHKKHPETFTLVRMSGPPTDPKTSRQARTQGGSWLMINTTPTDVIEHKKVHYAKVPAAEVEKLFDPKYLHQAKVDGAAALYRLLADRIEVLSYRPTTEGRPIVHTYRVGGTNNVSIPKRLVGTVLRGELYGKRTSTGRSIPPQELGGILNSSTMKSLQKQRTQRVDLQNMIFNVLRLGKEEVPADVPYAERLEMLKDITKHLPKRKFHLPEMAGTPEEQRKLWSRVTGGKHPLTHEGIVAWPKAGGKPTKVKIYDDYDVHVKEIFPGKKRLADKGAGGFKYSLEPEGEAVGEVGTGFSEELRETMFKNPKDFIGRIARIRAQGQFPSGAYRAPSLIGMHEDYPATKAAASAYDAPMSAADIEAKGLSRLLKDPAHKWRASSGIELMHKEPTRKELQRIWNNWQTMSDDQKTQSDEKSQELFGMSNKAHIGQLLKKVLSSVSMHEDYPATKAAADKPFRERAEMYALSPSGKLLSGLYPGGDIGVFGGGVDAGEDVATAAAREMAEESGREVNNPRKIPIGPFAQEWGPPFKTEKERARAKRFRGSRTHYIVGDLGKSTKTDSGDTTSDLKSVKLRLLTEAIKVQEARMRASTDYEEKRRLSTRWSVLMFLLKELKDSRAIKTAVLSADEQERVGLASEQLLAPTDWGSIGSTMGQQALLAPMAGTAWGGARLLARKLKSPLKKIPIGPGAKGIGAALKKRWTLKNLLSVPSAMYSPVGAGLTVGYEGVVSLGDALSDPDYMSGDINLSEAYKRQLKRMGQASTLKTHKAWKSPLKGLVMTPLHGAINPLASYSALWQAVKRPWGKKESSVLSRAIEKVGKDLGAEAHTLGDLVKVAAAIPAQQEAPISVGVGDRLRAWMIGMDPQKLVRLRRGLSTISDVFQSLQQAKAPQ